MSRWILCVALFAGLTAGCREQSPGADGVPDPSTTSLPPASPRGPVSISDTATNSVVIADSGDVNVTLQQLTQALRDYVVQSRSVPKEFEDFAAKAQLHFPPAPDGKKYAIQGQAVVLVKR